MVTEHGKAELFISNSSSDSKLIFKGIQHLLDWSQVIVRQPLGTPAKQVFLVINTSQLQNLFFFELDTVLLNEYEPLT